MSNNLKIILFFLLTSIICSCDKEEHDIEPIVNIYSPTFNEAFILPNLIKINFSVEHNKQIEYVRLSIVNYDMNAISDQYYLYPEGSVYTDEVELAVKKIPNELISTNYYVHIAVSDFNEVHHTYLEIDLTNPDSDYVGCFVIGKHEVNMLNINYYNNVFDKKYSFEISGKYSDSDISEKSNMLIITTSIPDFARGINCENGKIEWKKKPQLPYPEFNKVMSDNNLVYLSTEIGRIMGLTADIGNQVYNTTILRDTIPENICITNDYVIADYRLRNSNVKLWASFYKQTGSKYNIFITNFETINLYHKGENKMIAFCNNNSSGQIISFNIGTNTIENTIVIDNKSIQHSCKLDNNNYLFSSNNSVFHINLQNKTITMLAETDANIIDMKYNYVFNQLFIANVDKLNIHTYPDFIKVKTIEIPYHIKAIELLYGY